MEQPCHLSLVSSTVVKTRVSFDRHPIQQTKKEVKMKHPTARATKDSTGHGRAISTSNHRMMLAFALGTISVVVALLTLHHATIVHSSINAEDAAVLPPTNDAPRRLSNRIPLTTLTTSHDSTEECPDGLVLIQDRIVNTNVSSSATIPLVIHQTSKSRCLVPSLADTVNKWKSFLPHHDYYLHDDAAVETLLSLPRLQTTFPLLQQVAFACTRGAMRADLWRYVLLWEYGGIYSDIDTYPNTTLVLPNSNNATTVDAYFVLEQDGLLSQYFMAVAPKHPLMFYTIQHTLINLLKSPDPRKAFAPTVTGPRALHQGFQTYCGSHYEIPDSEGQWFGTQFSATNGWNLCSW